MIKTNEEALKWCKKCKRYDNKHLTNLLAMITMKTTNSANNSACMPHERFWKSLEICRPSLAN